MTSAVWRGIFFSVALGMTAMAAAQDAGVQLTTSAAAERAFTRAAPRPAWVAPMPLEAARKAHGPYSFALNDVQIHLDATRAVYTRRAIAVHAQAALEGVGRVDIDFLPDFQTLELHGVWIVRDGKQLDRLKDAQVRFLQREAGLDQGIYTGAVTANLVVADLRVGDVLDVEYTIRGANPVMGGKFFFSALWDSSVHVGRRRVVLDAPDDRSIGWRVAGQDARPMPAPRSERRGGRTRLTFEAADQAAWLGEQHVPPELHPYRWLQFSEMASWADVNRWAGELFTAGATGPAFDALLAQVRAAGTPEQQVVKALEFAQGEVRYLSVSIGENSHRPAPPETVLQRRYGDCKDKSLLLAALLRRLGLEANVALVWSDMPAGLDKLLPSPQLFDHAIVHLRLDGREYLLDPTRRAQHGRLENMGQPWRAHQVLVVRPGAGGLTVVAGTPPAAPLSRRSERFELDKPGSPADLTVTREYTSFAAEAMRAYLASSTEEEHVKQLTGAIAARYPDAAPVGGLSVQDDRAANVLVLTNRFRVPNLFTRSAQRWRIGFSATNLDDTFNQPDSATRRYPLLASTLHAGDALEYDFTVRFRQPVALAAESNTTQIQDAAFDFKVQDELDPNGIHMRMNLRALASRVAPQQLSGYAHNLKRLAEQLGGSFTVSDAPAAAVPVSPQDALRRRLEQLTGAFENAAYRGIDPAAVLCERARVQQALGQPDAALKDVQQAVRLQPKSEAMLACRADQYFAARRFKEAEADYGRAATLGLDSAQLYAARAVNAVYLGQEALAAAQFRLALSAADNDADRLRARIWLSLIKADGAGGPAPQDERWLARVLDAAEGRALPGDALAEATGDGGALADARLGEAYFYLGRLALAKGERWKALAYFRQALAKLAPDHAIRPAAGYELARMEEKK